MGKKKKKRLMLEGKREAIEVYEAPRPRVAILVPSYKNKHLLMQEALGNMLRFSARQVDAFVPPTICTAVVHWTRNIMLAALRQFSEPFDYVLYIDDDIVPCADSLLRLLSHNKHIVAGLCTRRVDPPIPNARVLDPKTMEHELLLDWKTQGLLQVDAVGTGMILLSRAALDIVGEFYMRCGYERVIWGSRFNDAIAGLDEESQRKTSEAMEGKFQEIERDRRERYRTTGDTFPFQFLANLRQKGEYGEDVAFCVKASFAGLKIYVDTEVQPGHIGEYPYSIQDYLAYKDQYLGKRAAKPSDDQERSDSDSEGHNGSSAGCGSGGERGSPILVPAAEGVQV